MYRRFPIPSLLWLCCGFLFVPGAAQAMDESSGSGATIIPILPGPDPRPAPTLRILEENGQGLLLEFELSAIETAKLDVGGEVFDLLAIEGGGFEGDAGEPEMPTFSRLVAIPDRAGVRVAVTSVETRELAGLRPMPHQPDDASGFVIDAAAYARAGYGDSDRVLVGEPALARDLRVVPVTFRPVRFDPARNTVEVAARLQVRVEFDGEDTRNVPARPRANIPPSFDQLYREMVVNYSGPRDGQRVSLGSYVIICPNNSEVISRLQPLIEWRTRKGFEVRLATTAETGTSKENIKAWIQNAYNTWSNPPEYIALVGDTDGTIAIPHWNETYSGYGGETDHPYVQLAGGDILADAHIGRISVDTYARLSLYVNKIVGYESTPYMTDTSWYTRACLTGDPGSSGYTCVQIMQWHKSRLREWGYTQIDTIFTSPFVSQMTAKLNQGDTVFGYRGYYGMSGFDTGHITALTNGWKMPFAVNLTCGTGSFSSYSRSEAWIRAGNTTTMAPTGGIASIGTATLGTTTRHNNCMYYGIWRGVFWENMFRFGESLTRGKYELYVNYSRMDFNRMCYFTCWNNLMGDPAGEIWTGVPQTMAVSHPAQISVGASSVTVSVTAGGAPCAGAYVCLWKGAETFVGGYTNPAGTIELPVSAPTTGEMKITVSKHDHKPYLGSLTVGQQARFAGYLAHTIDDDTSGTSFGNGNGLINPTERIELPVQIKNFGTQSLTGVTGTISCDSPYVTILDADETFGDLAPGATAWSADDFDIEIAPGAPHGHAFNLALDLTSGVNSWRSLIPLQVVSAEFSFVSLTLYNVGSTLDPGESGQLVVRLHNTGAASASGTTATLTSQSSWLTVTDASGTYGTIIPGGVGDNSADRFGLSAAANCFPGHIAGLTMVLQFSGGARDTVRFSIPIGTAATTDPTGPDAYGYYAFDNTDTGYSAYAPTYSWIEIDPNHGGAGTSLGLTDFGNGQDNSKTITLPFAFQYYGETFTRATICSNGWLAMGSTYLTNYRNWHIPGAGAPNYMIATMWDDLYQSGNNRVYTRYDSANHRFIVQWSRMPNINCSGTVNAQAILYDPQHHPTATGDGIIVFQYHTFSNCDALQHYCTIGIQNGDQTDGVLYTYYNYYTPGSATVQAGRAIKFMPIITQPRGTLSGTVTNASNGGTPVPGAQIHIVQTGDSFYTDANGAYTASLTPGTYSVTASHPSFTSYTFHYVYVGEGQTTTRNFSLTDILPPAISGTTLLGNTADTFGPYAVTATITDYSALTECSLIYNPGGAGWTTVALQAQGADQWAGEIPGQAENTLVRYYIRARDAASRTGTDPAGAPAETYYFWILAPIFEDAMEAGPGGWTHAVVTDGFVDQWHMSTQRNHTPGGGTAWKFGAAGGGDYAILADGALVTEPLELTGGSTLTFWHWIAAEVSGSYPGYAYDGGLIEMSLDGEAWSQVSPEGGYPYLIRPGGQPGPFPADTPVFSGTADWTQVQLSFGEMQGTVQLRFRFGSDGATGAEGWYIDDVYLIGDGPGAASVREIELRPERLAMHANLPNPFGGAGTLLRFDLPQPAPVRLEVFDAAGRLVRTLVAGSLAAGQHSVFWNGLDANGHAVGSGVYFSTLDADGRRVGRRMLMVR